MLFLSSILFYYYLNFKLSVLKKLDAKLLVKGQIIKTVWKATMKPKGNGLFRIMQKDIASGCENKN